MFILRLLTSHQLLLFLWLSKLVSTEARIKGECCILLNETAKCQIGQIMVNAIEVKIRSEAQWKPLAEYAVAISNYGEQKLHFCNRPRCPLQASIKR